MARTAPVPNIPAIPGMNPGIFVMGGGGAGGGGSGKGGKGQGGAQGAGGENAGDGAEGGGENAGSCGAGSGAGCPNPSHGGSGTAAGDPVDVFSGRVYTLPTIDLALGGPLPLRVWRVYSSHARERDIGLGRRVGPHLLMGDRTASALGRGEAAPRSRHSPAHPRLERRSARLRLPAGARLGILAGRQQRRDLAVQRCWRGTTNVSAPRGDRSS